MAVLECSDLRKTFGDRDAVRGVSFFIDAEETYGLLGPNGAGKTTTISMVCGILKRDRGEVHINGQPLTTRSVDPKGMIGFVPQDLAIYPDLTARENLAFFGKLYGVRGVKLKKRVDEVLEIIGLTDRANDQTKEFSGGMKRRLNIGIGLLHKPELLVLDEPTVGVDPQSRNAILESVEVLSGEGMAVLYTTHYMEEAERLCDRVGIIDEGEVKAEGTRRDLVKMVGTNDKVLLEATGHLAPAAEAVRSVPGVVDSSTSDGTITVIARDAASALSDIMAVVATAGAAVKNVTVDEPDLESVFLHLTGRALRD